MDIRIGKAILEMGVTDGNPECIISTEVPGQFGGDVMTIMGKFEHRRGYLVVTRASEPGVQERSGLPRAIDAIDLNCAVYEQAVHEIRKLALEEGLDIVDTVKESTLRPAVEYKGPIFLYGGNQTIHLGRR